MLKAEVVKNQDKSEIVKAWEMQHVKSMMANWDGKKKKTREDHDSRLAIAYEKASNQQGNVERVKQVEINTVARI